MRMRKFMYFVPVLAIAMIGETASGEAASTKRVLNANATPIPASFVVRQPRSDVGRQPRTEAGRCAKDAGAQFNHFTKYWWPPENKADYDACINRKALAEARRG